MMTTLTIMSVSVWAQDSTSQKAKTPKLQPEKIAFSCPMHPEITSDKPGKCSKCGMALVKSKNEKVYVCPMHPDVTSNAPGKCPKCKMALKEKKKST